MTALLSEDQIATALGKASAWERDGASITRTAKLPSFPDAIAAVGRIADQAERAQHHPDIDIRYRDLTFALSTHSEGGLTEKDFDLAGKIDSILGEYA